MNCHNGLRYDLEQATFNQTRLSTISDTRFIDNCEWELMSYSYKIGHKSESTVTTASGFQF